MTQKSRSLKRLVHVACFVFLLFCSLIVQFYRVQITQGEKWVRFAQNQHQYVVIEPFIRGSFFSNTSVKKGHPEEPQPFVMDVSKFHLFIDPDSIPKNLKSVIHDQFAKYFCWNQKQKAKLKKDFFRKSRSRKIVEWLDPEQRDEIRSWWLKFAKKYKIPRNAIYFVQDYKRSYPYGSLLGQVLHTVQDLKDPKTSQNLPTGGLELKFHDYLKGRQGKRLILRSPKHHLDAGKVIEEAQNGADVYLTINHYLQAIAEDELEKGVKAAQGRGGWCIMMDPYTGEVLALAQYPRFDPRDYRKYYNNPELLEHTRAKAITDSFEPGSIFKPLMMTICLRGNLELEQMGAGRLFDPEEKVPCSNGCLPGRKAKPIIDGRVHKYLNMDMAIQKSSNIYVSLMAKRVSDILGDQWLRNALIQMYGFGKKTFIEIPGEHPGIVPTPGKMHPNGRPEWSTPTPYAIACGHNILVTQVQMAQAYCAIANGGKKIKPTICKQIVRKSPNGEKEVLYDMRDHQPKPKQILLPEDVCRIRRSMKYVTRFGGTSRRGHIPGYTQIGKSGTSEKIIDGKYSQKKYISSFAGIVPADNPRFVLIVSIDEPVKKYIPNVGMNHLGGVCASPVFKNLAKQALQYLGVEPDDPHGFSVTDPRYNPEKADWVAENSELKKLYEEWNR